MIYYCMQESMEQPLIALPSRSKLSNCRIIAYNLISNAIRLHVVGQNPPLHICVLRMHTIPQYSKISCKLEIRQYIEAKLKNIFSILIRPSQNIIITTDRFEVKKKMLKIVYGNIPIELHLQKIDSFNFCEKVNSLQTLKFINRIINSILKQHKYSSNNKNNFYFKPFENTALVPNILSIKGFSTSISCFKNDMLLFVKDSTKYLSSRSLLEEIDEFYYKNKELQKYQRRIRLQQVFKNAQIMCQYGANKIHTLQNFVFDANINSIWIYRGRQKINLKSYYHEKYSLRIENCRQPLIKVYGSKQSLFIPEFMCRILRKSELKDRQEISSIQPSLDLQYQQANKIHTLLKGKASFATFLDYKGFNITIQEALIKMKGVALQYPTIRTAKGQIIDIFHGRTFQFQGKSVFQCEKDLNICIICPTSVDINCLKKDIIIATDQIGVTHNIVVYTYGLLSAQQQLEIIKQMICIQKETKRKHPTNVYWIFLAKHSKGIYSQLKRITINQSIGVVTQISMANIFDCVEKKKIVLSIINQMVAKIQGKLWIVENKFKNRNILMIGIYQKLGKNKQKILGFCSNKDPQISQYNSRYFIHCDRTNTSDYIKAMVMQAIQLYLHVSKSFPEDIIIVRNQHQFNEIQQKKEIQQILEGVKNYYLFKPRRPGITYLTIKILKYLQLSLIKSDSYSRPFHGLLISSEPVAKDDFILVNEFTWRNSYVYYRKLYKKSMISFDQMAQFLYHQTFNYYNFQGGISVPAVLKYAEKQAHFISKLQHLASVDHFSNLLYFL